MGCRIVRHAAEYPARIGRILFAGCGHFAKEGFHNAKEFIQSEHLGRVPPIRRRRQSQLAALLHWQLAGPAFWQKRDEEVF
jgi:hypothetical protein